MDYLSADARRVVDLSGAPPDDLLAEMDTHGHERSFPTVGPAVGRLLRTLARLVGASRIFEFGSGFGYSAAWFAEALPPDGEIVLTDFDEQNLDEAREFLSRGGYADRARFVAGDAMETFRESEGPWDVVLVDHEKTEYRAALEMLREELATPAVVVADNVLAGPADPGDIRAALEGDPPGDTAAGIAAYIKGVRDDPAFETSLVPLGEGITVSYRG